MVEAKCIVQGLSVGYKKMQTVVLSIFEVSEHDNQPELEHELLPQYVIDTREHDGTVCFFRNDILQYETATRNGSSAEDTGRIDTSTLTRATGFTLLYIRCCSFTPYLQRTRVSLTN